MKIADVADVVKKSRLGWFGHLERKDARDWVSAYRNVAIAGNYEIGRPKKRWNGIVKRMERKKCDPKKCGLHRGLAEERERWMLKL